MKIQKNKQFNWITKLVLVQSLDFTVIFTTLFRSLACKRCKALLWSLLLLLKKSSKNCWCHLKCLLNSQASSSWFILMQYSLSLGPHSPSFKRRWNTSHSSMEFLIKNIPWWIGWLTETNVIDTDDFIMLRSRCCKKSM